MSHLTQSTLNTFIHHFNDINISNNNNNVTPIKLISSTITSNNKSISYNSSSSYNTPTQSPTISPKRIPSTLSKSKSIKSSSPSSISSSPSAYLPLSLINLNSVPVKKPTIETPFNYKNIYICIACGTQQTKTHKSRHENVCKNRDVLIKLRKEEEEKKKEENEKKLLNIKQNKINKEKENNNSSGEDCDEKDNDDSIEIIEDDDVVEMKNEKNEKEIINNNQNKIENEDLLQKIKPIINNNNELLSPYSTSNNHNKKYRKMDELTSQETLDTRHYKYLCGMEFSNNWFNQYPNKYEDSDTLDKAFAECVWNWNDSAIEMYKYFNLKFGEHFDSVQDLLYVESDEDVKLFKKIFDENNLSVDSCWKAKNNTVYKEVMLRVLRRADIQYFKHFISDSKNSSLFTSSEYINNKKLPLFENDNNIKRQDYCNNRYSKESFTIIRHHPLRCELIHGSSVSSDSHNYCCRPSHLCYGSRIANHHDMTLARKIRERVSNDKEALGYMNLLTQRIDTIAQCVNIDVSRSKDNEQVIDKITPYDEFDENGHTTEEDDTFLITNW